ncbi:DUF262 domain-containing protein [Campylobacter ureolyticus]|uniref:DUF262 domain-containing protein n=1 Tax=Campylobacter ureolyticus TaxID=827 RepID=UPI000469C35C|nr:DUF262 domain-containing protein [Campylobacter ureolyticus]QIX85892.1 DUF262 domain-containing protein [Campylobacter ureolyticus]STA70341.1 Uncharacterized conserved protein [Campylobacter ureolyticus]
MKSNIIESLSIKDLKKFESTFPVYQNSDRTCYDKTYVEPKFIIPLYQREYVWQKEEVETLINDLEKSEGAYYIGNIVVDENYNVIDGQQRLTTLYLMQMVLSPNECFDLSYEIRQSDNEFLKSKNLDNLEKCENENIRENLIFIKSKKDILEKERLLDKVRITLTKLPHDTDITRYFELINSRGLQLEKHQILKAKFLDIFKNDESKNDESKNDESKNDESKNDESKNDESKNDESKNDESNIDWAKIWDYCSSMDCFIEDIIVYKNQKEKVEDIRDNFLEFLRSGNIGTLSYFKKENTESENKKVKILKVLKGEVDNNKNDELNIGGLLEHKSIIKFDYLLLNVLKFNAKSYGIKKDIVMSNADLLKEFYKVSKFDINFAKDFIKDMLKFRLIFDYFVFKRDVLDEPYFRDMRDKENFFNIKDSKALQMIELLFNHTAQNYKAQEWVQEVVRYVKDNLLNNENFDLISELENKDKERAEKHTDKELDKGTKVAHYWFYRLEYLLWKNFDNYFKGDRYQIVKERYYLTRLNSIEHIQPQSEATDSFEGLDENGNRKIDNFGNLALLTSSRNSSLGKQDVVKKKVDIIKDWIYGKQRAQSLKMILALDSVNIEYPWKFKKAQEHGRLMKELLFRDLENNN